MTEKSVGETIRPTKKQQDILAYIENFIGEHGYSPSYREIKNGLEYMSLATVAEHINSLIKRGHLVKREHSARSLEITTPGKEAIKITSNKVTASQEKWLVEKVEHAFVQIEQLGDDIKTASLDNLYVLIGALKVLGLDGAAQSFIPRLSELKNRQSAE